MGWTEICKTPFSIIQHGSGLNITQRYGNNRYITTQQLWIYKEYQAKPRSFLQRDISHNAANEIKARLTQCNLQLSYHMSWP